MRRKGTGELINLQRWCVCGYGSVVKEEDGEINQGKFRCRLVQIDSKCS